MRRHDAEHQCSKRMSTKRGAKRRTKSLKDFFHVSYVYSRSCLMREGTRRAFKKIVNDMTPPIGLWRRGVGGFWLMALCTYVRRPCVRAPVRVNLSLRHRREMAAIISTSRSTSAVAPLACCLLTRRAVVDSLLPNCVLCGVFEKELPRAGKSTTLLSSFPFTFWIPRASA